MERTIRKVLTTTERHQMSNHPKKVEEDIPTTQDTGNGNPPPKNPPPTPDSLPPEPLPEA